MAVLDGHLALAQIISRGQRLAQSAQLSISPFGPDAAGVLPQVHFPEQQQLDIWGPAPVSSPSTHSPVLSAFSGWSGKDLEGAPTHSPAASSVSGSVTSTPVRMGPLQHAVPFSPCSSPILCWAALTQKPAGGPPPAQQQALPSQMPCSSTPTAHRCLCAALASSTAPPAADAAAPPEAAAGCSTPRGSMIPAVLPPPPAPRAPRPTARLLPLEPPAAAAGAAAEAGSGPGSSSASLCAHLSMGGHSRLQQWLSQMELKLAVPAGNTGLTLADACPPAPKASLAGMHPEAAPTAARPASSSTGPGSLSKAHSNSSASSKKRPLPALWDTLSLLPVGGSLDLCIAADLSDESDSERVDASAAGASASGSLFTVRSSKRRSLEGVTDASSSSSTVVAAAVAVADSSTGAAAAQEGAESAADGVAGSVGGVPAPAFVVMGVLSPRTHLA